MNCGTSTSRVESSIGAARDTVEGRYPAAKHHKNRHVSLSTSHAMQDLFHQQ